MKWEDRHIHLNKLAAIFLLVSILGAMPIAVSDPLDSPNSDGTRILTWNFDNATDYVTDNTTLETDHANLSTYQSIWHQTSNSDFGNGTDSNNIIVSAGEIRLALDTDLQMLANGGFSIEGASPGSAEDWDVGYSGNYSTFQANIASPGGYDDIDGFGWRNWFMDFNTNEWYDFSIWLNQTVNITNIPLNVNISAFHNFTNNSFELSPGSIAGINITNLNLNETYNITSSGWINSTFPEYQELLSTINPFNETGLYNISLFTRTNTSGNVSYSSVAGIENFWDNA